MASQNRLCSVLVVLLVSHSQPSCAARRSVVSSSIGQRALKKTNVEEERLLAEAEAFLLANSNMSLDTAYQTLKQSSNVPADLLAALNDQLPSVHQGLRRRAAGLVQRFTPSPGVKKAKNMVNKMINENNLKLDTLKSQCSNFFRKQCALMETCRSEIASANSEAASERGNVLKSQAEINRCEDNLPRLKVELSTSESQCTSRLGHLNTDLKIVLSDIDVMTAVLKLTECKASMLQTRTEASALHLVECKHPCSNHTFLAFHHNGLNNKLGQLQSSELRERIQQGLRELATDGNDLSNTSYVVNKTMFKNPPLPQTPLPQDPCKGITYDAGGKGGCSLRSNPQCFNLQNKFLLIQGECVDKRDDLLQEIKQLQESCAATHQTLKEEIGRFQVRQDKANSMLATATAGETDAAQEAKEKGEEHSELSKAMMRSRKECSAKMRTFESELCALKKIRGELFKMKGDKHPFFQDCQVSKWEAEDCSKSCAGGIQLLKRSIVAPESGGGASCPPLTMKRACNQHPCPIDCKVSTWSGYSACSADCGGGVRQRTRRIKVHPKYDGTPCGDLTETEPCNIQACDRDCKLGHWSKFGKCSKACGGGEQTSERTVKVPAIGQGKCSSPQSARRLKKRKCGEKACPKSDSVWKCKGKIDLLLLLDASASMKDTGFKKMKEMAKMFVTAFKGEDTFISVILFSGPHNWADYKLCNGPNSKKADQEKTCGIKMVQHFTNDTTVTQKNIEAMPWLKGSTYTAKALELANTEIILGRKDAMRVVVTITDGMPISVRNTDIAAKNLRKKARLIFGAVRVSTKSLGSISKWASKPTRDNVMRISSFEKLKGNTTMNRLLRDICVDVKAP